MAMVIQIGADVQAAVKGVKDVSLSLNDQKQILKNLRAEYAALTTEQARGVIGKELAADIKIANDEIKRLGDNSKSAFTSLSRGVGEVISPIRQLAYILPGIGVAGIFNLAFTGIEALFNLGKAADDTTKKIKDLIKTNDELRGEAGSSTSGEIAKVSALAAIIEDQTRSYKERNNALNELKEINKNYFGNLTLEAESLKKLTPLVEEYTKAVTAAATVKAFSDEIGKANLELFHAQQLVDAFNKTVGIVRIKAQGTELPGFYKDAEIAVSKAKDQVNELNKGLVDAINLSLKFKPLNAPPNVKINIADLVTFDMEKRRAEMNKLITDQFKAFRNIPQIKDGVSIEIPLIPTLSAEEVKKLIKQLKLLDLEKELSNVATAAGNSFAISFGEGLGKAISGGGLKSIFSSLFSSISQAMKAFGEALIKFGIGALAIKNLITNPALAIAAGIALIAASTIIASSIPKFGEGGIVNGATLGIVGERGPEVIAPLDQLRGMIGGIDSNVSVNVSGVIKGNDLALIAARTQRSQNRTT